MKEFSINNLEIGRLQVDRTRRIEITVYLYNKVTKELQYITIFIYWRAIDAIQPEFMWSSVEGTSTLNAFEVNQLRAGVQKVIQERKLYIL